MDLKEIDLGNGLVLKHVMCDPCSTGHAHDFYEIWDIDPVDDKPIFTGDYLAYDYVIDTFKSMPFADAADTVVDEILFS